MLRRLCAVLFALPLLMASVQPAFAWDYIDGICAFQAVPPTPLLPGQAFEVKIWTHNVGKATWKKPSYYLGFEDPAQSTTWGITNTPLRKAVPSENTQILTVSAVAPSTSGWYPLGFRMAHDNGMFFGIRCPINVYVGL